MQIRQLGAELGRKLPLHAGVEVTHKQLISWSPAVAGVAVEQAIQRSFFIIGGVQSIGGREARGQFGAVLPANFAAFGNGVEHFSGGTGFS